MVASDPQWHRRALAGLTALSGWNLLASADQVLLRRGLTIKRATAKLVSFDNVRLTRWAFVERTAPVHARSGRVC
jgi:hypothetical protein